MCFSSVLRLSARGVVKHQGPVVASRFVPSCRARKGLGGGGARQGATRKNKNDDVAAVWLCLHEVPVVLESDVSGLSA